MVLEEEAVRARDRDGVWQAVALLHGGVPFEPALLRVRWPVGAGHDGGRGKRRSSGDFRQFQRDKPLRERLRQSRNPRDNRSVPRREIAISQRLARITADAENAPAAAHKRLDDVQNGLVNALQSRQKQHRISAGTAVQKPVGNKRIPQHPLADVVRAAAVLRNRLPENGRPLRIEPHWEGLVLRAQLRPEVAVRRQDGDGRDRVDVLQHGAHPGAIVIQETHIGPPGVALIMERPVLHPAGEGRLQRRIVEAVPDRVRDAGEGGHIRADLQELQRRAEHQVRIGHLFGADHALAGDMRRRGDIFIDHRIRPSAPVILVAHFLAHAVTQPVRGP